MAQQHGVRIGLVEADLIGFPFVMPERVIHVAYRVRIRVDFDRKSRDLLQCPLKQSERPLHEGLHVGFTIVAAGFDPVGQTERTVDR